MATCPAVTDPCERCLTLMCDCDQGLDCLRLDDGQPHRYAQFENEVRLLLWKFVGFIGAWVLWLYLFSS